MSKITIYKHDNFGNPNQEFTGAVNNLSSVLDNHVSSCKVEGGAWILYGDANYRGKFTILEPGEYENPQKMGIDNDHITSLRPLPESGICLFQHPNYGGNVVFLDAAHHDLRQFDHNDIVSSVIVLSGTWNLYQHTGFGGEKWTVPVGNYPTPESGGFRNQTISSVRLATYQIGDIHPDGGIVFMVNDDGMHGMICAPEDLEAMENYENTISKAKEYKGGGWSAPLKRHLDAMYKELYKQRSIGDFKEGVYRSTEFLSAQYQRAINFSNGQDKSVGLRDETWVRPVKSF